MRVDVTEVRTGLWQVTMAAGYVNCHLVKEEDGLTAIDTGLPTSAGALLRVSYDIGAPIVRILLTHTHRDHAGGLNALKRRLPDAKLMVTQRAAQALGGRFGAAAGGPKAPVRRVLFSRSNSQPTVIGAGEVVGRLTVLPAPGHSPEHVAYWLAEERVLLAGDAFTTRTGSAALVGQPRAARGLLGGYLANMATRLVTWHFPTALASAQRLRDLRPEALLVGHGPPLERPCEQLDEALSAATRETATLGEDEEE